MAEKGRGPLRLHPLRLYEHYLAHPEQLPAEYLEINFTEGAERAVCDFIACMTDRYAIDQFSEIFVPGAFGDGDAPRAGNVGNC